MSDKITNENEKSNIEEDIALKDIVLYKNPNDNWKIEKLNGRTIEIPIEWNIIKNGKMYIKNKKSEYSPKEHIKNSLYPLFNCSKKQTLFMNNYITNKESILLSTGGLPSIHYINEKHSYTTDVLSININKSYNAKYYFYHFKKNIKLIENSFQGSGLKHLSKLLFNKLKVIIPKTLSEQNKIAKILTSQEELIKNKQKLLKKIKKQTKYFNQELLSGRLRIKLNDNSIRECLQLNYIENVIKDSIESFEIVEDKKEEFEKWLLVDYDKKIELYLNDKNNWKSEKINEKIVKIPNDWGVDKIINHLKYEKGISIPEKKLNSLKNGIKYLKTSELWLNSGSKRETLYYNEFIDKKYIKLKNDYVFSLDGFNTEVGKGTLGFMSNEDKGIVSTGWYKVIHNNKSYFMINVWNNKYINKYIVNSGVGTTAKHAGKFLKTYEFNKPIELEMILMNLFFKRLEEKKDLINEEIKKDEKLFQYLKQELLSGRLRVK